MATLSCFPIRKRCCRHEWNIRADEPGVIQSRAGQEDSGAKRPGEGGEDKAEGDAREGGKFRQSPFE